MDYDIANSEVKPNYMQRRALKELNRVRAMGTSRALIIASAGSGKTFLAAFDALNFAPKRLLYIVHEGSILMKSYETFQRVFGSTHSYGIFNGEYKEQEADFVFSTCQATHKIDPLTTLKAAPPPLLLKPDHLERMRATRESDPTT